MRLMFVPLFLLAAGAVAQMPLPPFSSTYTQPAHTRGFYFQTPVGFTITGLRVPDETNHGLQNVAVYKLTAIPPTYPATATGGLQFYQGGVASSVVIAANVSFNPGDWVGIFGACGDSTTMRNSYGTGPFQSSVLGQPVTLSRFLTQTNLVATQGAGAYSGLVSGSIARVEVYVNGVTLQGSGPGTPGTAMNYGLNAPQDGGLQYVLANALGNGPTPIGSRSLGLSLDSLFSASVSNTLPGVFYNYNGVIGASGRASATLNIPNFQFLKGIMIYAAFVTVQASAPLGIQNISNTHLFTIT